MSIETVAGRLYGPHVYSTARTSVSDYVSASGDDPDRWTDSAPGSLAGAMLFVVAPDLLGDPELAQSARSVIHGEQTFSWMRPIPLDSDLAVTGTVTRVRERGGVFFVGFEMMVSLDADPILTGTSMFLMSGAGAPAGGAAEEIEPAPDSGSRLEPAGAEEASGPELPALTRSASRADLVRYAGASHDFNPIHWDHGAAVAAGLPGVVVHGLLQSAWLTQGVERTGATPRSARFRYRAPLRPAVAVTVEGRRTAEGWDTSLVSDGGVEHVAGAFVVSA
jgi:acyl dehydratase